jgi:hypothetical protein
MDRPGRASLTFFKTVNCYFAFLSWYLASSGRAIPKVFIAPACFHLYSFSKRVFRKVSRRLSFHGGLRLQCAFRGFMAN